MANRRIVTYKQAFQDVLGILYDDGAKKFISELEAQGHTEKSICYAIWRSQEKLLIARDDKRFKSIFFNEIRKWSWTKNDHRWEQYNKRKEEQSKAAAVRNELDKIKFASKELNSNTISKSTGFVYFIQGECGGAIKIGYSVDPEKRLKQLQTGYPDNLKVLLVIPGSEKTEKAIHYTLKAFKLNGEWFRPDNYVIDFIKNVSKDIKYIDKLII